MKANSRDGQRAIAKNLASKLGRHSISTRKLRKLQCQILISGLLNRWNVQQMENGDLKLRRG